MKTVILYHGGCPDGFGAAWWLRQCLMGHDVEMVPMNWHDRPPIEDCVDASVWSVDWCPDAEWIKAIDEVAKYQTIFDHHQSSLAEVEATGLPHFVNINDYMYVNELGGLDRTTIVIDQNHSGIGLVATAMKRATGIEPPWFAKHIEDRDLWKFDYADTKAVSAYMASIPMTVGEWSNAAYLEYMAREDEAIAAGEAIMRYTDQLIEAVTASTFELYLGDGDWALCCAAPYKIGSDAAGVLAARSESKIGAYAIIHADHIQIGLRSTADGPDVAKIAERHIFDGSPGGGHAHASGLKMTWAEFFECG